MVATVSKASKFPPPVHRARDIRGKGCPFQPAVESDDHRQGFEDRRQLHTGRCLIVV